MNNILNIIRSQYNNTIDYLLRNEGKDWTWNQQQIERGSMTKIEKIKLFFKKVMAYVKIFIPFTKITIKNIKEVVAEIKQEKNK